MVFLRNMSRILKLFKHLKNKIFSIKSTRHKVGEIVSIVTCPSPEGFSYGSTSSESILIFKKIDLQSYPSFHDFLGSHTEVKQGDIATVIRFVGRPIKIREGKKWSHYDVYEIMIHGSLYQAFAQTLICREDI